MQASTRKSVTDLTRRKARAVFAAFTLAVAVSSVGIFGVSSLMQQAMDREIDATKLADLTLTMKPLPISEDALHAIERLPNVAAVQPKSIFSTRVYVGDRRQRAIIIGVPSFDGQRADVITATSGARPRDGELLGEVQNAKKDRFAGTAGAPVRILAPDGGVRTLRLSGEARYLGGGQLVTDAGVAAAVFYATTETVAALSSAPGYTMLALRLRDTSDAATERTSADVREELSRVEGFTGFADLPEVRAAGDYPGKELFEQIVTIMTLITALALISALVLVSNTMTTLIGEQTGEIASMKAIGASRRQIGGIYLRTAFLFGVIGAITGTILGIALANAVTAYFGRQFYGIDAGFHIDPTIVAVSLAVGLVGPPLAAAPAIRRAMRLRLADALQAQDSVVGGQGRLDRMLRRATMLPRSAQIGLRGVARRKRRSAATALQVAVAVGTLLALLSLGTSVGRMTHAYFEDSRWDVWAQTYASEPFDPRAAETVRGIDGVAEVQPLLTNLGTIAGTTAHLSGLAPQPMYTQRLTAGRWYTDDEARSRAPVIVIGGALANRADATVGDTITLAHAAGATRVRVVGISTNEVFQGTAAYLPLGSLQRMLGTRGQVNNLWIRTDPRDHRSIDRIATRVEDTLGAGGNQVTSLERYVSERDSVAANAGITSSVTVLGLLIVLLSLVGLVNAITMGVIERTREIGMLRCVGARARDVRRIFAVEGLVVAGVGWIAGVPLGWAMAHGLDRATSSIAHIDLPFLYPLGHVALTFAGTLLLALVVLLAPVRRAVRLRPGEALRYA